MTEITKNPVRVFEENAKPQQNKVLLTVKDSKSDTSTQAILLNIDLVKYPIITEKTYLALYKNNQYTFDIDKRLTKTQIKILFSKLFKVDVIAVNTHIPPRQQLRVGMAQGFRPCFKRAIVTLKQGQSIDYSLKTD